jgi:acyl carrier protein
VVPVERSGSEPSLAAYWVPCAGCSPDLVELRGFLRRLLPPHLIPAFLVPLAALPRSPGGKLDLGGLPAPGAERSAPGVPYTAPRSELEGAIAGIWREVLGLDQVGVEDNFFDLGGRSLELTRVNTKLRQALAKEILMTELFRYPTVASLAAHLQPAAAAVSAAAEGDERAARRRALMGRRAGAAKEAEP